jgi:hypothetical protein
LASAAKAKIENANDVRILELEKTSMKTRLKLFVTAMCLSSIVQVLEGAPISVSVTDVGLDASNNVTSITTGAGVITPANLIGSTADLSNVSRVFNGSGVAPANVAAAQPYAGDMNTLTGLQDIAPTDYLKFTFNAPINTVDGNVDFVFMHARAQNPGISFQAVDAFGADIPGALVTAVPLTDINKGANPANWFYGPLPGLAVIGNFPQHTVFTEVVGFGYTGTIGGVKVILGSPTGSPVVTGGTIEVYEALGVTGVFVPEPGSVVLLIVGGLFGSVMSRSRYRRERTSNSPTTKGL